MIRNAMFGLSLLALSAGSALAAPVTHHASKPRIVAQAGAPAADATAPASPKAMKKTKKSTKKATKTEGKTEGAKEMKAAAPATK